MDPDEECWYQVVSYFDASEGRVVDLPKGGKVTVLGSINDICVVRIGPVQSGEVQAVIKAAKGALEAAGIQAAIIIPDSVEFLCLRRANPAAEEEVEPR